MLSHLCRIIISLSFAFATQNLILVHSKQIFCYYSHFEQCVFRSYRSRIPLTHSCSAEYYTVRILADQPPCPYITMDPRHTNAPTISRLSCSLFVCTDANSYLGKKQKVVLHGGF